MYLNEKIRKVTIQWNGGSLTTSRECQFLQELVVGSLFQAPRETREGECEGTKTRGEWGREKEGKKRSLESFS